MTRIRQLRLSKWSNATDAFFVHSMDPWVDIVAVTVLAATAWQIGLLNALSMAAFMILGIPIGVLVDRIDGVRVLQFSLIAKSTLGIALFGLTLAGFLNMGLLMLFVSLLGIVTVASETAQVSIVPSLSSDQHSISRTVANIATWDRIAALIGPAAIAYGISQVGETRILGAILAFAIVAMIIACCIKRQQMSVSQESAAPELGPPASPDAPSFSRQVRDGWNVLMNDPQLAGMTWLSCCANAGLAIGSAVEAILIMKVLDLGIEFFGILGSVGAIAGIAASVLAERISQRVSVRRLYLTGGILQAAAALLPLAALYWTAIAPLLLMVHVVVWAIVLTVTNVSASIYAAVTVDQGILGRIASIRRTLTMGVAPLSSILGGVLGSSVGIWLPLALWPVLILVGVAIFWSLDRSNHRDADVTVDLK